MFTVASIKFITVKDCRVEVGMNLHGHGSISGIVSAKDEENVIRLMHSEEIEQLIYTDISNKDKVLFSGLIETVNMKKEGELLEVRIVLIGATKKLDILKKTRTFQNLTMSYKQIVEHINMQYKQIVFLTRIDIDRPIDDLIVQYNETDWEFLKRIASSFNVYLYPDVQTKRIVYFMGVPEIKNSLDIEVISYNVDCSYSKYREKREHGLENLIEEDCWVYTISTREAIGLGEEITFHGMPMIVKSVNIELDKGELIYTGELIRKRGLVCEKKYNEKLIGASLDAYVTKVSADKVQAKILCDVENVLENTKWFLFSTVFSSADGTGWYCMPEEGDRVRLYFPDDKEENGYIISAVHENVGQPNQYHENARTNPDNKSISTKYGKQIELTPTRIVITNNQGTQIVLDDAEGIHMICDKDIVIESQGEINVVSSRESLSMIAEESIELIQGNSKVVLKDDIIVEGVKFKVQ